jgi:NAD(P)-dependent dehydrogenase (short-subunit alcohol dehydrogenase family)
MAAPSMTGRKALVTGAGTGIGRGVALEFAREGADVVLHYAHSQEGAESAAAEIMTRQGQGTVINVSSVHAYGAMVEHAVYAATKAAIVGFTRTLSLELIQRHIRVNCIAPGWVLVDSHRRELGPEFDPEQAGLGLPSGFIGEARGIGRLAVFLASEESRYTVGQTILCDGGQTTVLPCTAPFRNPGQEKWGRGYVPGR